MELDPHNWTCEDVGVWLEKLELGRYVKLVFENHKIDGLCLLQLTEKDLKEPPLSVPIMGDIKKLFTSIYKLKLETIKKHPKLSEDIFLSQETIVNEAFKKLKSKKTNLHGNSHKSHESSHNHNGASKGPHSVYASNSNALKPEFFKLSMAFTYFMLVGLLTTFTMVVVHDRVPNMDIYPPLPDIVLDNIPLMPWAFDVSESIIIMFSIVVFVMLLFHKHRFIIARRMFALSGTVFLLRCVTMLITSLSVPGTHLHCEPRGDHTLSQRVNMALKIWSGMGMSLQGVRTCGDYLFSGHTVVVTMFNFFINEYTSERFKRLHQVGWIGNFMAIFFILAAHEHYSIDVFIAFYITSRLFLYYHSLANNKIIVQRDSRTQVWFPLFSYFEASIDGRVPNEIDPFWTSIYNYVKKIRHYEFKEAID